MTDRSFSLFLILGVSVSSQTVENENQSTLNISHKTLWSQNIQRSSDSSSTCSSQLSSSQKLENEVEVRPKYKIYGEITWKDVPCEKVEKIPNHANGLKHYVVKDKTRSSLLAKCKDGRKWKRDSCTKCSGYDSVRYQNCAVSFYCPNIDYYYFQEYDQENCVHVDKKGICQICGAECKSCDCRKYVAFQGYKAHIFHAGIHLCTAKKLTQRPSDVVQGVLSTDLNMKPSTLHSSVILKAIRERRPWKEVRSITDVVCNTKYISNEKTKQKNVLLPDGTSFAGIENLKSGTNQTDKYLIYKISINEEYVFKTSKQKLLLANNMDSRSSHYLNYEFCYFDGKVGRVKDFITLTASVYHLLVKRQITLATMECKHEDSMHVKLFWNLYNDAYKEANNTTLKYESVGWCSEMAG